MLLKSDTGRITLYKHVNMTRYGHKPLKKQNKMKNKRCYEILITVIK